MTTNPLVALGALGQSPWYDYITRDLLQSGQLAQLIGEDGLRGMTSNPTIFEKAVAGSEAYHAEIAGVAAGAPSPEAIFEAIAVTDVRGACDVFDDLYAQSDGVDGLVSLEVSPTLAHDAAATIVEAERLWTRLSRPNAMIKIPGTQAGLPAITHCIAAGINVNVTLLFGVPRYEAVIEAFQAGLEQRVASGRPVDRVASVASFFVSRLDTKVDPMIDRMAEAGKAAPARSVAAIANAAAAYAAFQRSLESPRWKALAARGARPQRPLWASTSTKDPRLPDTYYVDALIAPQTVNTLPPETFAAFRDHGQPVIRIDEAMARAPGQLGELASAGIDLAVATRELEEEGVDKFAASYRSLLSGIEAKAAALVR